MLHSFHVRGTFLLVWLAWASGSVGEVGDELSLVTQQLALRPGMVVADVGAGDGDWSVALSPLVGERGRVLATEVDAEQLERIAARVVADDLTNIEIIAGSQETTGLEPSCCDAILLRMVYHHFVDPARMRRDLARALRSGGLIAIIDIEPQSAWRDLPGVPDRGGHGIPRLTLQEEMSAAGFELVSEQLEWNGDRDRYCLTFRRSAQPPSEPPR